MDSSQKPVIDKSCGKSSGILFFALFLLMLVILGNIIKKGEEKIAWMLYVIVILLGLGALVVLVLGTGYSKNAIPWGFSVLTLMMTLLATGSIAVAKPSGVETSEMATAYIAALLPGLCGFLYSPLYSMLKGRFAKTSGSSSSTSSASEPGN